jgi:hypothetical protein
VNIHNFTNRQLCEYASIFPTVAALLDHLLFTIGNGYEFDEDTGMIRDGQNRRIDEYPAMTPGEWTKLIDECHVKELKWATQNLSGESVDKEVFAENCARYKIVKVTDSVFTEDAIYAELVETQELQRSDGWRMDDFHRPYPLSERYSDVYNLNANTPRWFVQIALNFCKAWVRFLNEAIENNDIWIKPSLRPKDEPALANATKLVLTELFADIKADPAYDGWLNNTKEAESDYGDLTWTTKHRDMLVTQVQRLEGLLANA